MSSFGKYFYEQIGKKVRQYRIIRGLTQEQLSDILGLNDKYIGHIERCERHISVKTLTQVIDFFQVQPKEFFTFDTPFHWENCHKNR